MNAAKSPIVGYHNIHTGELVRSVPHFFGIIDNNARFSDEEILWTGLTFTNALDKMQEFKNLNRCVGITALGHGVIVQDDELHLFLPPHGTYECQICGRDDPHTHSPEEAERDRKFLNSFDEKRRTRTLSIVTALNAKHAGYKPLVHKEEKAKPDPPITECISPECGCKDPVATDPLEMLQFLSGRFKYAGVGDAVAKSYARDIDAILAKPYSVQVKEEINTYAELVKLIDALCIAARGWHSAAEEVVFITASQLVSRRAGEVMNNTLKPAS